MPKLGQQGSGVAARLGYACLQPHRVLIDTSNIRHPNQGYNEAFACYFRILRVHSGDALLEDRTGATQRPLLVEIW
jgi:hypothetical protein